LIQLFEMHETL